jgi:hypothetical protein
MGRNLACLPATAEMDADDEPGRLNRPRQRRLSSNFAEQDRCHLRRLVGLELGFDGIYTARRTLAGYGAVPTLKEGQVHKVGGRDMLAQATLVAERFEVAPNPKPFAVICGLSQTLPHSRPRSS